MSSRTSKNKVITRLRRIRDNQNKIITEFLKLSLNWIEKKANSNLDKSVNKDFPHPTTQAREYSHNFYKNRAVLSNDEPNSAAIEFGIGQEGLADPHPLSAQEGYLYDVNGHGFEGWEFYLPDGTKVHTYGYGAKAFLYKALVEYMDKKIWVQMYQSAVDKVLRRICK